MSAGPRRDFILPEHERAIRAVAVDPRVSVFLSANAGSGKTTILTERVIRLMLEGAEPARILCLTYTKAAAAEMQNRIFTTLAGWVALDDAALAGKVGKLTGRTPAAAMLERARALFARAVETPGGLKIQTIHAFSERLLHLFPFEANVPVRFTVMDDAAKTELIDDVRRATLSAGLAEPATPLGAATSLLIDLLGESDLDDILRAALPKLRGADPDEAAGDILADVRAACDLRPVETEAHIAGLFLSCGLRQSMWPEAIAAVRAGGPSKTDGEVIAALERALALPDPLARARAGMEIFLTEKDRKIRERIFTKAHLVANPWLDAAIAETKELLPGLIDKLNAIRTAERSAALTTLALACLRRFRAAKAARALIDFDDMIDRVLALVADPGASWVLRKLDGGIDHLLIDEAQDTTPEMWQIARALTGEFFAGEGARPGLRTVFAVGDEKQSIYSFQGARPEAFAETRRHYARVIGEARQTFAAHELKLSFRTVADVLGAVDRVFSVPERFTGLTSDPVPTVHDTARAGEPGHVELWPLEAAVKPEPREAWEEIDALGRHSPQVRLASRLARTIAGDIRTGHFAHDGRAIRPGDIMILIQRRDPFFDAVIRALKREGVPVAGADRLKLGDNIAVMDLIAAARVALLPEDDLSLAAVLKSPLVGLTDDDLIALAPDREGSLHAALCASSDPAHAAAAARIAAWRRLAARETPYGFFAAILSAMGGRRALLARLGMDAADGIDMFLDGVRERERRGPSSLVAEIEAFAAHDVDVKRDQEQAGDAVRVLTVHGAKGLEAPIVYLPDANRLPNLGRDGRMFRIDPASANRQPLLLWSPRKEETPRRLETLRAAEQAAKMEEYRRLFYVAMTRAKDRLIIAGWGDAAKVAPESWYGMARAALAPDGADLLATDEITLWRTVETPAAAPVRPGWPAAPAEEGLPAWALRPAPRDPVVAPPLRPSRALDAPDQVVSPERVAARQRGDLIHALIERLPEVPERERADAALRYLTTRAPALDPAEAAGTVRDLIALLARPDLAALFGPGSRAEVAIAGDVRLADGRLRPVMGRIDRLAIGPERIIVADYKTGHRPAGGPSPPQVLQLALYAALVGGLYPGVAIETLLLWTRTLEVDVISPQALAEALTAL